ncbi:MAG: hypothetical protein COT73_01265 [Bdellovibrio sp. CG10_big_fil_rev_8_21_14_0_10_47_8]|nr:MAG: hypothetical protein COT73_01265 [Bdellovibrio sp. CG10_big_fil_rev_8_21_14_0_10_47_8]
MKDEKFAKLFSLFVTVTLLGLCLFSFLQLGKINTAYSFEDFFPRNHPLLEQSRQIRRTFELDERSSFLVVLERKGDLTWLTPPAMKELKEATELANQQIGVNHSLSLATLEGALDEDSSLVIGPLYDRLDPKKWTEFTASNPLIRSQLISEDYRSALLLVTPDDLDPGAQLELSKTLSREISAALPNVTVETGGGPAIQGRFSERLFAELKLFVSLSFIAFGLVFLVFFRGLSAFLLTLLSLFISNITVLGGLAFFRIPFSVLLSTLPIIISISLISVMIHSLHRWAEILKEADHPFDFMEKWRLTQKALREMLLPNFLGSTTTAIGFATLCFTDIPLIRQYGWVVATSVMVVWGLTQLLLMAFMCFTKPTLRGWTEKKSYWTLTILKNSRAFFLGLLVLAVGMALAGRDITFSGRLFDDLPKNELVRQATDSIDNNLGGVITYDVVLTSPQDNFWKNPDNLKLLDQSNQEIRKIPSIGSSISVPDFLPQPRPKTLQGVAEFLFMYSLAQNNPLKNYITENGRSLRISIRFHDFPSDEINSTRETIQSLMKKTFPELLFQDSGHGVISHTLNREVSKGLITGFWHSLVLIGLLLMLIFRSLRWALVSCLPNLIPPAILLGLMAIVQTPIKPGIALIFSIALGLAFNNTVYLLSRLKRLIEEKKISSLPLRRTLLQEGNPCLFETLIMFCGFVIFLSSDFRANQMFGIYMVLSIVAGALGDLVFLPAMLQLYPGLLNKPLRKVFMPLALIFIFVSLLFSPIAHAEKAASNLLKQVQKQVDAKDDQALVKMNIIEANGEIKTRTMKLQTLRGKKSYALVRIESPADIRGTALLSEIQGDEENQWLYLPSTKQVRRVVNAKKGGGVLGSELTINDLNSTAIRAAEVKILKKDAKGTVLEVNPKAGTSIYSRVLILISAKDLLPTKTEYFQKNKVVKTVDFLNYTKINNVWRSQLIQVRNLLNKRGTDLELSDLKVNSGLTEEAFTVNTLKTD